MWRSNVNLSQTIFALASGTPPTAVAIVRLSGPQAFSIARDLFVAQNGKSLPTARGIYFGHLLDEKKEVIDQVLLLSFVAPHSYSGEDVIEIQCHGSVAVIRWLENELIRRGVRYAERGEFSYRALLNGKKTPRDLENLADVFTARHLIDLRRIYERKEGVLENQIQVLREHLIRLQAILDTAVDFSEEYSTVIDHVGEPLEVVTRECSKIIQRYRRFQNAPPVPRIVLAGRPNAGKSSLFNALLCRYRAIVHSEAGTTRDVIEEEIELGGQIWKLVDTAGIRETTRDVERDGISLGGDYLASAHAWLLVVDGCVGISQVEEELLSKFHGKPSVLIWNKSDRSEWKSPTVPALAVSATTGAGLDVLWDRILEMSSTYQWEDIGPLPTGIQCAALQLAIDSLAELQSATNEKAPPEYLAELNRRVLLQLDKVVGEVDNEEIYDRIFSECCIGK